MEDVVRVAVDFGFLDTDARDLVIIGGGVAGYVAAIKAGQEGMKVRDEQHNLRRAREYLQTMADQHCYYSSTGHMYREARHPRRDVSQRRLHPLKIAAQQLAPVPPDPARHEASRHRGR